MANGWTVRGMTDECTTCELCGRRELRGTVHLVTAEGDEIFAGTSCAARRVGTTSARMRGAVQAAERRAEMERYYMRESARLVLRVLGHVPDGSRARAYFEPWKAYCFRVGRHCSNIPGPGTLSGAVIWAREVLGQ